MSANRVTTAVAYAGQKRFTIHRNDAGSEAYRDEYVKHLEQQLTARDERIAKLVQAIRELHRGTGEDGDPCKFCDLAEYT